MPRCEEEEYIVSFVEVDLREFHGVHSKVMVGNYPEQVARRRVAEEAKHQKEEHLKCTDGLEWEEVQESCLEDEEQIRKIISGFHPFYMVFVFTTDGEKIDIDC